MLICVPAVHALCEVESRDVIEAAKDAQVDSDSSLTGRTPNDVTSEGKVTCHVCARDVTRLSVRRRLQHVNFCLERVSTFISDENVYFFIIIFLSRNGTTSQCKVTFLFLFIFIISCAIGGFKLPLHKIIVLYKVSSSCVSAVWK